MSRLDTDKKGSWIVFSEHRLSEEQVLQVLLPLLGKLPESFSVSQERAGPFSTRPQAAAINQVVANVVRKFRDGVLRDKHNRAILSREVLYEFLLKAYRLHGVVAPA